LGLKQESGIKSSLRREGTVGNDIADTRYGIAAPLRGKGPRMLGAHQIEQKAKIITGGSGNLFESFCGRHV